MTPEEIEAIKGPIVDAFEANCSAYHSTAELYDDGVIDPRSPGLHYTWSMYRALSRGHKDA